MLLQGGRLQGEHELPCFAQTFAQRLFHPAEFLPQCLGRHVPALDQPRQVLHGEDGVRQYLGGPVVDLAGQPSPLLFLRTHHGLPHEEILGGVQIGQFPAPAQLLATDCEELQETRELLAERLCLNECSRQAVLRCTQVGEILGIERSGGVHQMLFDVELKPDALLLELAR